MNNIEITSITGLTPPYQVYICNVYQQNCVLLGTISVPVPGSITLPLPPQFQSAPAVGIKLIATDGCERFNVRYCT